MSTPPPTGLLVLHGNRLELLAQAVLSWLQAHPLQPLEEEVFLVQSNGMAEWLKMEIAGSQGICAATRVELPARFIWRAYREVLGRENVPRSSALDKLPLTWRLMQLLPALCGEPGFEPVAGFLGGGGGDAARRLQLAQRLADLLDQYQVYRSDWLEDWGRGIDQLRAAGGGGPVAAVPPDQRWQPALWRALLQALPAGQQDAARPALHRRFLQALRQPTAASGANTAAGVAGGGPGSAVGRGSSLGALPRRLVLFGTTHIPHQTLEAVAALSAHCQVLMAVPNPCRFHWADIIDGRELLRATRRRHALRPGPDPATLPLQDMHALGHPLLAAWGRQGRDFVRQLDVFDDVQAARQHFDVPRVDLFDEGPGTTLLGQVQAAIRELLPLAEHPVAVLADDDRSIVFHLAHSAQREVEILHDQLLHLFAQPPAGPPLNPRDVVVMVPDIERFAPAIRAVFGQHSRGQPRHIPWGIADQKSRGQQPILVALEWLLRAPQQRFGASEVRDLLDVPSVARRWRIAADDLPTLAAWIDGAGIRWGLDAAQRDSLGLGAAGEQNSWAFGLRRMLLGYATGALESAEGFAGIEPHAEVAGLSAGLAGALAELLQALAAWWHACRAPRTPPRWAERLRDLVAAFFDATDDADRAMLAALDDALAAWLQACEVAGFDAEVDLAVAREAWLGAVDEPGAAQRFKAGGVTFCTLLPMRAIPFEVVCLLGMNDGDYPRRGTRSDFDLMALPGQARPGDRSRRDDDRQLMLDALLSARRVLYVSWAGRSQRDNQEQPPSVLVSQLRDYLAAAWGPQVVAQRSTQHPLQPFSRSYFEPQAGTRASERLFTYASEWRAAHLETAPPALPTKVATAAAEPGAAAPPRPPMVLSVAMLAEFIRNPVKAFFRHRLQVSFHDADGAAQDDESFESAGLDRWGLADEVLREARRQLASADPAGPAPSLAATVQRQVARLKRAGRLPAAGPGRRVEAELARTLLPMVARWQAACEALPCERGKLPLRWADPGDPGLVLDDWLPGLRSAAAEGTPGGVCWVEIQASKLARFSAKAPPVPRADKLVTAWVRCLAAAACGHAVGGIVIGEGAAVHVAPPPQASASEVLATLMRACADGLRGSRPWPSAVLTGLAFLKDPVGAEAVYDSHAFSPVPGEGREACLARLYPGYSVLRADPGFEPAARRLYQPLADWLASHVSVEGLEAAPQAEGMDHE
jgi:exodeoxyribonuclease V gamma subunit